MFLYLFFISKNIAQHSLPYKRWEIIKQSTTIPFVSNNIFHPIILDLYKFHPIILDLYKFTYRVHIINLYVKFQFKTRMTIVHYTSLSLVPVRNVLLFTISPWTYISTWSHKLFMPSAPCFYQDIHPLWLSFEFTFSVPSTFFIVWKEIVQYSLIYIRQNTIQQFRKVFFLYNFAYLLELHFCTDLILMSPIQDTQYWLSLLLMVILPS